MTYTLSIPHGSQNARTLHLLKLLYNYYITLCNLHCIHIIVYCNLHCIYMWLCLCVRIGLCVCIVHLTISVCIPVKWLIRGHIIYVRRVQDALRVGRMSRLVRQDTGMLPYPLTSLQLKQQLLFLLLPSSSSIPHPSFLIILQNCGYSGPIKRCTPLHHIHNSITSIAIHSCI